MEHKRKKKKAKECKTDWKALFAQPLRNFYEMPEIELRDKHIVTDGCKKVISFSEQAVALDMGNKIATFYGENLQIEFLEKNRVTIYGTVERVKLDAK